MGRHRGRWIRSSCSCAPAVKFGPSARRWAEIRTPQTMYGLIQEVRTNMRNILRKLLPIAVAVLLIALTGLFWSVYGQTKKRQAVGNGKAPVTQQPLFTEYKGVKLGMAAQEVRAKLGDPVLKSEEMDYFIFPNGVTAQVAYDSAHQVRTISIDYAGGA